MANPQREDGHLDIANDIVKYFCRYRLSGQEWQVLWVIFRKTWGFIMRDKNDELIRDERGYVRKKQLDMIPLSQFQDLTGIDRRKCHTLIKSLINKRVIRRVVTQKGDRKIIKYGFIKDYEKWKLSPKRRTVTHIDDRVSPNRRTKLSPKRTPSKETTKETLQKKKRYSSSFEKFWLAYPRRNGRFAGSKQEALERWEKLSEENQALVMEAIPNYANERDPKYIKDASGWLNKERWRAWLGDVVNEDEPPKPWDWG